MTEDGGCIPKRGYYGLPYNIVVTQPPKSANVQNGQTTRKCMYKTNNFALWRRAAPLPPALESGLTTWYILRI